MPHARLSAAAALALCAALAGCRDRSAGAQDSTFIATMAELRNIDRTAPTDSAARAAVLRRRRISADSLERVARTLSRDPARASRVWMEIERRVNERAMAQGRADAAAAAPPPAATPGTPATPATPPAAQPKKQ